MRMNTRAAQTAADIVNNYTAEALADVFYLYGELKVSRKLASVLVKARRDKEDRDDRGLLGGDQAVYGKGQGEEILGASLSSASYRGER